MPTAVIYARYSSSKQREASISDQLRECHAYCEREGIKVVREYCDYALSGRSDDRPEFQRMIANAGESDFVVVYMLDRFSRDQYDAPIYKKQLKNKGVTVLSALEHIDQSPDGIIMEKLLEALAARESMITGIRAKRGMEGNAKKGLYNGDRCFGYGVDESKHYVIDEEQAALVREAFARRLNREPVHAISKDFALRGVRTYSGKPCSPSMVWNMLKNERYTGVYKWGEVRIEGGMPSIIDRGTFDAVQKVRSRKQRINEAWEEYALSGKAICGKCGRNMVGVSAYNHQGKRYDYYRCGKKCGLKQVRKDMVEALIIAELRKMLALNDAVLIADAVEKHVNGKDMQAERNNALERLRKAKRGISNLVQSVEDGMPFAAVRERMEQLQEVESVAKKDLERIEAKSHFDRDRFIEFMRSTSGMTDKMLLDMLVWQVVFLDGVIAVTLAYSIKKGEPRRFEVRTNELWLPECDFVRTTVRVIRGEIVVVIPFAA